MISVNQAIKIVEQTILTTSKTERIALKNAFNFKLAEDVISPIDMPPFRQSAMDGYAVRLYENTSFKVIEEIKAGDHHNPKLNPGESVRIYTGAAVPDSANAVVMQEKTKVIDGILTIASPITLNENIRPKGEQIKTGEIALKKGATLNPAAIGFLASLGISDVKVFKSPKIAIVVTGNELIQSGDPLTHGKIYESNAIMLISALKSIGYTNAHSFRVEDDYQKTVELLRHVINEHDMILISGGISVGDYDFVSSALQELEVDSLFYKVNQKPGKPFYFGKKENKIVFALPGNPASSLSCFYVYVQLALHIMSGDQQFKLPRTKAKSKSVFAKKGDRAQFLKAIYKDGTVEILNDQNSSMLNTFALANALVFLNESDNSIQIDDIIEVILLP